MSKAYRTDSLHAQPDPPMVAFLASDESRLMIGSVVVVDAGLAAQ